MSDPNYVKAEARSLALLQRYCIETPDFDVEDIAYDLGIDVVIGGISSGDARIIRTDDGRGVIRLNKAIIEPSRQRFSVAHELGHWELHPNISQGYLCTGQNLRDYGKSAEEAEANWFAATLLMPKFMLPPSMFRQDPSFASLAALAGEFRTSVTAAARRFVELSKQPIVLVASSGGIVTWTARSSSAKERCYYVAKGSPVPVDSVTREAVTARTTTAQSASIEPSVWFPELSFEEETELFEEAKFSVLYGTALTLLWIP